MIAACFGLGIFSFSTAVPFLINLDATDWTPLRYVHVALAFVAKFKHLILSVSCKAHEFEFWVFVEPWYPGSGVVPDCIDS